MFSFSRFICLCSFISLIKPICCSQHSYDSSRCTSQSPQAKGSKYSCNSTLLDCNTYIVYRAHRNFDSISSISSLFNVSQSVLLTLNNMTEMDSSNLPFGLKIILPLTCNCDGQFFQAIYRYKFSSTDSFEKVACGVFEGLVKAQNLAEENPDFKGYNPDDPFIKVPIKCACADVNQSRNGVKYLVTYPVVEGDHADLIATKFRVSEKMIWDANGIGSRATIFPKTTLLIPMADFQVSNLGFGGHSEMSPGPKVATPLRKVEPVAESAGLNSHVFLGIGVAAAVLVMVIACAVSVNHRRKHHPRRFQPLSARSSTESTNLSPDFRDGVSKLKRPLIHFKLEVLRIATEDFSEAAKIGTRVYQGRISGSLVAIEQVESEEAAGHVISVLTKINHLNIVKLQGWCPGSKPYLVFDFLENGSLRDCLSHGKLTWARRRQIAFDVAVALHYLHYCTKPAFAHCKLTSRHVLITADWRTRISGFTLARQVICSQVKDNVNHKESVILGTEFSPEYLTDRLDVFKLDVFAFGVVLLEMISGKEVMEDWKVQKELVHLLVDEELDGSPQCMEKLNKFMDPCLQGDCPLDEALFFAILAKVCIKDNPRCRPTMDDILKVLSRALRFLTPD